MPVPRLRIEEAALLVVDVQERLMPTIVDAHRIATNSGIMLRAAAELDVPYLVTEQYPRGLGRTVDEVSSAMRDQSRRVEKTRFSAAIDLVVDQLDEWNRSSILICGIEAHVCVLQTALDLLAAGRQVWLVSDAISASQRDQIQPAYRRMERAGAITTGALSVMYELMGDAKHPAFGALLELAKGVEQ